MRGNNNNTTSGLTPKTIKDIAFDVNEKFGYTVYIQEDGSFEPYLVIDGNYNNRALLLKKYLEGEDVPYSPHKSQGSKGGYYPQSNVDQHLNTVFLSRFSPALQDRILDTDISVATSESVWSGGGIRDTENVRRKIFLLSATELNIRDGMACTEGKPLAYFKGMKNFVATNKNGEAMAYWLRSAYLWDDIQAWSIGITGARGGDSVSIKLAVRPAFCIDGNTPIKEVEGIVEGKKVYTLVTQ